MFDFKDHGKSFENTLLVMFNILDFKAEFSRRKKNSFFFQVEVVKTQFREHEQFMQSLTESQDSVGRVLHRLSSVFLQLCYFLIEV